MGANLAISILLFAVSALAGGDGCFSTVTAVLNATARLHEEKMDLTRDDTMLEILRMWGSLRNHNTGYIKKGTKETFQLARKLEGGYTVEMTYEKDTSTGVTVYDYKLLELVTPGGYRKILSEQPVEDIKWTFAKEFYDFDGPQGKFSVTIPLRIEGKIIREMEKWGTRLEFMNPVELQNLTSMSDLRFLALKAFGRGQKTLHITGTIKGYSKLLFNIATTLAITYFTVKNTLTGNDDDDDSDKSGLFLLLMNFKGGIRLDGVDATLKFVDELEQSKGPALISKEFINPEPLAGKSRVVTVSEYPGMITVVEMTYERGRPVGANAIAVPHDDGIFKVLSRSLRSK